MNVVIYSHVSSQATRQSIERQVADLRKFAEDRSYTVCAVLKANYRFSLFRAALYRNGSGGILCIWITICKCCIW